MRDFNDDNSMDFSYLVSILVANIGILMGKQLNLNEY